MKVKPKNTVAGEADEVLKERAKAYGSSVTSFTRIAKLWSAIYGQEITPKQVGLFMIALKMSREIGSHQRDNLIDICGYASLIEDISNISEMEK